MREVYICLVSLIIVVGGLIYLGNQRDNKRDAVIGERIILGKDTLLILKYSGWDGGFNLSNGVVVSDKLVEKIGTIK
jgi:hypothetical protein